MKKFVTLCLAIQLLTIVTAQDTLTNKKNSKYRFKKTYNTEATNVKDQCQTGTCWSWSSMSFLESEILRLGKGKHNLSAMYIVRVEYMEKAVQYVRMGGKVNFDQGGEGFDVPFLVKKYGLMPLEAYKGLEYGAKDHNHDEMLTVLQAMMDKYKGMAGSLTPSWKKAIDGVLDAYLGKIPEKFTYQGKEYTPMSFLEYTGLKMDDYVALTSFTHHPFYEKFVLEVPDNWSFQSVYNIPMNELQIITENSLKNKISVAWACDVSEKGFSWRDGIAIIPASDTVLKKKGQDAKYFNYEGSEKSGSAFDQPYPEKTITQQMRQDGFDNFTTTDDHGMHITGMVTDQNGTKYFTTKNSWGEKNYCGGYLYCSEKYFLYKTTSILVHKSTISAELKTKLGIK